MTWRSSRPVIILLVVVLGSVFLFYTVQRQFNFLSTPGVRNDNEITRPSDSYQEESDIRNSFEATHVPELPEVYSYSGNVIDTTEDGYRLSTSYGEKNILRNAATEIVQRYLPTEEDRLALSASELMKKMAEEVPYEGTIEQGDIITAISETNIQGLNQFTAKKILVIK